MKQPPRAPQHTNQFDNEPAFLEHYARARKIAVYTPNFIQAWQGMDLLGVPLVDEQNQPVRDGDLRIMWQSPPPGGWVPSETSPTTWDRVPFLAPHLQTTLVQPSPEGGHVQLRLTPEVCVFLLGTQRVNIRRLSYEVTIPAAVPLLPDLVELFKERAKGLVELFFPLHPSVEAQELGSEPQQTPDGNWETHLLIRFLANHDHIPAAPPVSTPLEG